MTHVCQYWRTTLISYPRLWSSVFVENDHEDFVVACLERSQGAPLAVRLDLKRGDYHNYPDCTCIKRSTGQWINVNQPCRYHTAINPLREAGHHQRIRTLDVHLTLLDDVEGDHPNRTFEIALDDFGLFTSHLPALEKLSFRVDHVFDETDVQLEFPERLFLWGVSPPTALRHLTLHGCYGGPILAIRNLTTFELAGAPDFSPIELNRGTFLPFISGNSSLVSLSLLHCSFPDRPQLSQVTPIKLPKLKTLRLMSVDGISGFPGLVHVPAFKRLSSLRISAWRNALDPCVDFLIHAESGDGFQLLYDATCFFEAASDWLGLTDSADPSPVFVRFERRELGRVRAGGMRTSPLVFFSSAKVLEISAPFTGYWYRDFWGDLEKIGPQLTTLRLGVIEGTGPEVSKSVEELVRARFNKGMPLTNLERMTFEETSEEDEEKAKKLWEEFRAGLSIDQYLAAQ